MQSEVNEPLPRRLERELAIHSQSASERFRRMFSAMKGRAPGNSEIALLNRFWHVQLGYSQQDTLNARAWLVNDVTDDKWLEYFKQNILPVVIRESLPVPLSQLQ